MRFRHLLLFAALAVVVVRGAPLQHEFIAIDEGLGTLLHVDERNPAKDWRVPVGHPQPRDLQLVGRGRILVGHDAGFTEFDLASGKIAHEVATYKGVTSARRLANGHTVLIGVNLGGASGVVLLELDAKENVFHKTVVPGNYVRLARETPQRTWLLMSDTKIREVKEDGESVHEWTVPGFRHAWKAVRLPNGNTLASAGYGAFLVELGARGEIVRRIGAKSEALAFANPNFYATFHLLANEHIVVANWQGHGTGHGASGVQLLEFDQKGGVVWQWSDASRISSLQGVMVLDGLDSSKLHDEQRGVMEPLE